MKNVKGIILALTVLAAAAAAAESDFFKKFKSDYDLLDIDLLNSTAETFQVENFVYQKDIATFQFRTGTIYLLRYVDGRATTAVFDGQGSAEIKIPSYAERRSLQSVTRDSLVRQDFEVAFIRMADDFDLLLREKFPPQQKGMDWKNFTRLKQSQGEVYFKPVIYHTYDNKFELLRSHYERGANGYFWIDFNRFTFTYDPNLVEPVVIGYEFEPNDYTVTEAAMLGKSIDNRYDDLALSNLPYPTTTISKTAAVEMGGLDGTRLEEAEAKIKIVINRDSLKFISTFMHPYLSIDSIYYNGQLVDYHRRRDFKFVGLILPEYRHKGDTISLTWWYHGRDFDYVLPYVENPSFCPHSFTFIVPKGFNYVAAGMQPAVELDKNRLKFEVTPDQPYNRFFFQGYATGFDTLTQTAAIGTNINFLKSSAITKKQDCFVPHEIYEPAVMNAFNYMSGRIGGSSGAFEIFVYPKNFASMPGLIELPQILCYTNSSLTAMGGFDIFAGYATARQWFGSLMQPVSYREDWLKTAAADYLALMFVQYQNSSSEYYSNLIMRRDSLYTMRGLNRDRPLFIGPRASEVIINNRGVWLFHMLRFLMYDLERKSEDHFNRFMFELKTLVNSQPFTNADIIKLAEKHYGEPLDWFFRRWLFNSGYPEFNVDYSIEDRGGQFFVKGTVRTEGIENDFLMQVIIRVSDENGQSTFYREKIDSPLDTFEFGPFTTKPKELTFNEFFSVLSKDKVSKK